MWYVNDWRKNQDKALECETQAGTVGAAGERSGGDMQMRKGQNVDLTACRKVRGEAAPRTQVVDALAGPEQVTRSVDRLAGGEFAHRCRQC